MADIEADIAKNGSEEHVTPLLTQKPQWYRSTLFNSCVIGGVGFLAPGLWNAMNSLGTHLYYSNSLFGVVFWYQLDPPFVIQLGGKPTPRTTLI